jgi:hypothetical protein
MRRALLGIALFMLCAGGIARPTTQEQDFPVEGMIHWGPFRVRPYLLLKDTGYDDNVFLDETKPVSDFTSTAEGGFRLITFFSDRAALQLEERLDYVWFAQNTSENHFNNSFRGRANFYLKKLTLFADLLTINLKERPATVEYDYRIRSTERSLGAGVKYERPRSSLEVRFGKDRYRYSSDTPEGERVPEVQNRLEDRLTVTGRKKLLPKTTFLLEWEGRGIAFDEPAGQARDSRARRISGGFELDPSAFLKGAVKIGVEILRPDDPQYKEFHGLVGEGALLYRMTARTNLEGRGRRNIGFTSVYKNVYYIQTGYGTTLTQFLAARVAGEIGLDREQVEYPEETQQNDPETGQTVSGFRTDEFRSYFVGASYRFNNQARMGLRVGSWRRISAAPFGFLDRQRNTAMVTYSYNF